VWTELFTYYTHTHFDFSAHFLLLFILLLLLLFFSFFPSFFSPPSSDFGTHLEENALFKSGQNEQQQKHKRRSCVDFSQSQARVCFPYYFPLLQSLRLILQEFTDTS